MNVFNRKFYLLFIAMVIILTSVAFGMLHYKSISQDMKPLKPQVVLFYSDRCPHCVNVKKYIVAHLLEKRVQQKEISKYKDNIKLLLRTAKDCGLKTDVIKIPFLWTGSKCLTGSDDILQYLEQVANEKVDL